MKAAWCVFFLLAGCLHNPDRLASSLASSEDIFTQTAKSSVIIQTDSGLGSGTIVWSSDRMFLVLTCAHVLDDDNPAKFAISIVDEHTTKLISGFVEKIDTAHDLALLVGISDLRPPVVAIAPVEPRLYERLYLVGAPMGFNRSATEGFLSSKNDKLANKPQIMWRVTGGLLWPGISGGSIVNSYAELVCVPETVMLFQGLVPVPQVGFCVPLGAVKNILRGYSL